MIYVTWNAKKVTVWKSNKPIYTIYLNGRNPYKVYEDVKTLIKGVKYGKDEGLRIVG